MDEVIRVGDLKIKCNIVLYKLLQLSIQENFGAHATAEITALLEYDELDILDLDLKDQPIMVCTVKDGKEQTLFSGVIYEVCQIREAEHDSLQILAYSLSWLMDKEKKTRSFQNTGDSVLGLIEKIADEHSFKINCSAEDKEITAPFIQYEETDWEFLLRLSSYLSAPVRAASDYRGRGIYVGFPAGFETAEFVSTNEKWCMDQAYMKHPDWKTRDSCYYEITTSQVGHLGDPVQYKTQTLRIHSIHMILQQGVLNCIYRLAGERYRPISTTYNNQLKGISLTGMVLAREGERIKIHLHMDEVQEESTAYRYPWLPDYGNMLYCMPEVGSVVRLLIPDGMEQKAIAINCVRQNGSGCSETQTPNNRCFATADQKKMTLTPGHLELSSSGDESWVALQDNSGGILKTQKDILIQSQGNLILDGVNVILKAPKEITAVRRQIGSPTVVNICHNLDAMGQYTTFKNIEGIKRKKLINPGTDKGKQMTLTEAEKVKREKEKREVEEQLKALMEIEKQKTAYYLGASITKIMAAIPQNCETEELAQIAVGFRSIAGTMED